MWVTYRVITLNQKLYWAWSVMSEYTYFPIFSHIYSEYLAFEQTLFWHTDGMLVICLANALNLF